MDMIMNPYRHQRMIRILAFVILLLAGVLPLFSHPGIGIVIDRRGNLFYTDLDHVWKISPDGLKSIAVRGVHTHELYIDSADNLYGEHLWYNGEAADTWGHRVWRLTANGHLSDIIPARSGFLDDYNDFHFVHNRSGTMYYAKRGDTTIIMKELSDGTTFSVARAPFRDVRWMTVTPGGTVYLIDLYDLVRVTPDGRVQSVVRDLADWKWTRLTGPDRHALMGLWTDVQENVYVASYSGGVVKRVSPDGTVTVVARSEFAWSPTGGLIAPNGEMWLLEYSVLNTARVRRIDKSGKSTMFD